MSHHPSANRYRILIFIDWFLPGDKAGGPVRSLANILDHTEGKFDFYVITRNTDYCETSPYTDVPSDSWVSYNSSTKIWYASKKYQSLRGFRQIIRSISCDMIYLNGIYSPRFSILPLMLRFVGIKKPILIAPRGMLAPSAIGIKARQKKFFLRMARYLRMHGHCSFHATNEQEKTYIKNHIYPRQMIFTVPNLPRKFSAVQHALPEKKAGELHLISVARIAPEKNTLYALEILKKIPRNIKLFFDLYGSVYNELYYQQCKGVMEKLPENVSVNILGSLAGEKVPEKLAKAHLMLLPTRGENFGHVILESLSVGTPVLISEKTPWQNLEEQGAGWDLPLSDPEAFSRIIQQTARLNQHDYNLLRQRTWKYAKNYLDNNPAPDLTHDMFLKVCKNNK